MDLSTYVKSIEEKSTYFSWKIWGNQKYNRHFEKKSVLFGRIWPKSWILCGAPLWEQRADKNALKISTHNSKKQKSCDILKMEAKIDTYVMIKKTLLYEALSYQTWICRISMIFYWNLPTSRGCISVVRWS